MLVSSFLHPCKHTWFYLILIPFTCFEKRFHISYCDCCHTHGMVRSCIQKLWGVNEVNALQTWDITRWIGFVYHEMGDETHWWPSPLGVACHHEAVLQAGQIEWSQSDIHPYPIPMFYSRPIYSSKVYLVGEFVTVPFRCVCSFIYHKYTSTSSPFERDTLHR